MTPVAIVLRIQDTVSRGFDGFPVGYYRGTFPNTPRTSPCIEYASIIRYRAGSYELQGRTRCRRDRGFSTDKVRINYNNSSTWGYFFYYFFTFSEQPTLVQRRNTCRPPRVSSTRKYKYGNQHSPPPHTNYTAALNLLKSLFTHTHSNTRYKQAGGYWRWILKINHIPYIRH